MKLWFKAAIIRAFKTFAQTALAMIGTTAIFWDVNWGAIMSGAGMAFILSLLTSMKGLPEVQTKEDSEE
jgi:hypothetical protein